MGPRKRPGGRGTVHRVEVGVRAPWITDASRDLKADGRPLANAGILSGLIPAQALRLNLDRSHHVVEIVVHSLSDEVEITALRSR